MQNFSIGKVSNIVQLPQSVLRYWESVFVELNPEKSSGGTRIYSQDDINLILKIKDLLYHQKFTIAGAKTAISEKNDSYKTENNSNIINFVVKELENLIEELRDS